ncbi:hypothetical protein CDAR_108271 [Caerostris darwini]|uniref:Uncharacterized protein n=1 Tax=Caerostris darwini TaxID=1538125 RepID=A0AAV4SLK2_9ARAC|nr:hypothetical protein CDAR_108271 [Caerostris darwini]
MSQKFQQIQFPLGFNSGQRCPINDSEGLLKYLLSLYRGFNALNFLKNRILNTLCSAETLIMGNLRLEDSFNLLIMDHSMADRLSGKLIFAYALVLSKNQSQEEFGLKFSS